mgnify:CR=1 FL=1
MWHSYESSVGDNYQRTAESDANNLAWLAALTGRANEAGVAPSAASWAAARPSECEA